MRGVHVNFNSTTLFPQEEEAGEKGRPNIRSLSRHKRSQVALAVAWSICPAHPPVLGLTCLASSLSIINRRVAESREVSWS